MSQFNNNNFDEYEYKYNTFGEYVRSMHNDKRNNNNNNNNNNNKVRRRRRSSFMFGNDNAYPYTYPYNNNNTTKPKNNLRTRAWGQPMWYAMIFIAMGYPLENPTIEQQRNYAQFFNLLQFLLPCNLCRDSYRDYLNELPLTSKILSGRKELVYWIFQIHNKVNKKLSKPELTNEEMDEHYEFFEQFRAKNCTPSDRGCVKPANTHVTPLRTYVVTDIDYDAMQ